MCLTVDLTFHKKRFGKYQPIKAETDIVVYKELKILDPEYCITPYQRVLIMFKDGIAIQTEKEFEYLIHPIYHVPVIYQGIHASIIYPKIYRNEYAGFYAIIPKGTHYYRGIYGDIVSKKLIIFNSYNTFKQYCIKNNITLLNL